MKSEDCDSGGDGEHDEVFVERVSALEERDV